MHKEQWIASVCVIDCGFLAKSWQITHCNSVFLPQAFFLSGSLPVLRCRRWCLCLSKRFRKSSLSTAWIVQTRQNGRCEASSAQVNSAKHSGKHVIQFLDSVILRKRAEQNYWSKCDLENWYWHAYDAHKPLHLRFPFVIFSFLLRDTLFSFCYFYSICSGYQDIWCSRAEEIHGVFRLLWRTNKIPTSPAKRSSNKWTKRDF